MFTCICLLNLIKSLYLIKALSLFSVGKLAISSDETKDFLTLQMLGMVLHNLSCEYPGPVRSRRPFYDKVLKVGEPNLLVTPTSEQQNYSHLQHCNTHSHQWRI